MVDESGHGVPFRETQRVLRKPVSRPPFGGRPRAAHFRIVEEADHEQVRVHTALPKEMQMRDTIGILVEDLRPIRTVIRI